MKTMLKTVVILLIAGILATGCSAQNTDFTLQVTPPKNLKLPLQGKHTFGAGVCTTMGG